MMTRVPDAVTETMQTDEDEAAAELTANSKTDELEAEEPAEAAAEAEVTKTEEDEGIQMFVSFCQSHTVILKTLNLILSHH